MRPVLGVGWVESGWLSRSQLVCLLPFSPPLLLLLPLPAPPSLDRSSPVHQVPSWCSPCTSHLRLVPNQPWSAACLPSCSSPSISVPAAPPVASLLPRICSLTSLTSRAKFSKFDSSCLFLTACSDSGKHYIAELCLRFVLFQRTTEMSCCHGSHVPTLLLEEFFKISENSRVGVRSVTGKTANRRFSHVKQRCK